MDRILLLNGPNLNMLGQREPELYGEQTLPEIEEDLKNKAKTAGYELEARQSNSEAELITWIQQAPAAGYSCILLNAGGLTHSSVSLRDAIAAVKAPTIEVHLTNIYRREPFRQQSLLSDVALGVVAGFGPFTYELALNAACDYLSNQPSGENQNHGHS